jgi:hypothetical protein
VVQGNTIDNPFLGNNVYDTYPESYLNGHPSFDMLRVQIVGNTVGGIGSYYNGLELDGPSTLTRVINNNRIANGPNAEIGAPESSIRAFVELASPSISNNGLKHARVGLNFDIDPAMPTIQATRSPISPPRSTCRATWSPTRVWSRRSRQLSTRMCRRRSASGRVSMLVRRKLCPQHPHH